MKAKNIVESRPIAIDVCELEAGEVPASEPMLAQVIERVGSGLCVVCPDGAVGRLAAPVHGLRPQPGDSVVIQSVAGMAMPVILAIVDGSRFRRPVADAPAGVVRLDANVGIEVQDFEGRTLVRLHSAGDRLTLQLATQDVDVRIPGRLSIEAEDLTLRSSAGSCTIDAADEVVINGEMIRLN